jgi:hypothetical protein
MTASDSLVEPGGPARGEQAGGVRGRTLLLVGERDGEDTSRIAATLAP